VTVDPETIETLTKARSLLTILLATCKETLLALEAAANVLDTQLTGDLRLMIERSEGELPLISEKLAAFRATSTWRGAADDGDVDDAGVRADGAEHGDLPAPGPAAALLSASSALTSAGTQVLPLTAIRRVNRGSTRPFQTARAHSNRIRLNQAFRAAAASAHETLTSTFNPKVAGSIPARPTQAKWLLIKTFCGSPVVSRRKKPRVGSTRALDPRKRRRFSLAAEMRCTPSLGADARVDVEQMGHSDVTVRSRIGMKGPVR
jgi:hypothetical protein